MAIIRRKHFTQSSDISPSGIDLIDTPEKLLKFAQLQGLNCVPLNISGVADKLGIHIEYLPLEDDLSGILKKNEDNNTWTISVNEDHHPKRQRYTSAHELAHFCLHRHLKTIFEDKIFFRGGKPNKSELQANEFASAILMPENELMARVSSGVRKVEILAKEFQVSTLALRIRAKNLGISGHG